MREVAARGKTILFATHYLEEADPYADRVVLIARGRIVADGPATEIKANVGTRTIRATLPGIEVDALGALPGVLSAERHGEAITLSCSDADAALSALLTSFPGARDAEVRGASLEKAFLELTPEEENNADLGSRQLREKEPDERGHPCALRAPSGAAQLAVALPLVPLPLVVFYCGAETAML